jgi:polysaccharide biosynthesis PFTS motif protein
MAFKKKREIGKRGVKKYLKLLEKLSLSPNVVLVPPSISPIRIIEKCFATISMPFTSTAHYSFGSSNLKAYYDPTGWIQKDDRGAHGVQILSGIEELRCWVKAIVAKFSNDLQGDLDRSGFVEQSKNGRV